jgi:tetratricopeptide (TPR) repeat protein
MILVQRGEYALADELLGRLAAAAKPAAADPQVRARILRAQAMRIIVLGDVGRHQELIAEAAAQFTAAGDWRNACNTQSVLGFGHTQLGFWEEAERELREALAVAERMGLSTLAAYAQQNLGFTLARRGALTEARAVEIASIEHCTSHGDARMAGSSRGYLAMILAEMGDLAAAEQEATTAIEELSDAPPLQAFALSTRARIRLTRGRSDEALNDAREATQMLRELGGIEEGEAQVRLVYAEALSAGGDLSAAREALVEAHGRLLERAAKIADASARRSFLERVPEHARTLALFTHSAPR